MSKYQPGDFVWSFYDVRFNMPRWSRLVEPPSLEPFESFLSLLTPFSQGTWYEAEVEEVEAGGRSPRSNVTVQKITILSQELIEFITMNTTTQCPDNRFI